MTAQCRKHGFKSRNYDTVRLLMLYIIVQDGISLNDRNKLIALAKLTHEEVQAIANLAMMGLRLVPSEKKVSEDSKVLAYITTGSIHVSRQKGKGKEREK